jgi:hypothetical protein
MAVETFDGKGDPIKGTKTIEIVAVAGPKSGVRFEGKDLLPSNGPHKVPAWFALELIGGGRAVEYDKDNPRNKFEEDEDVVNGDPSAENRDPKPAKQEVTDGVR